VWITFDTPQSRSLLEGQRTVFLPYIGPRMGGRLVRLLPTIGRVIRDVRPVAAVSTGAAIAVGVLPLARLHGASALYIESAARSLGPSMSGRMLHAVPGVATACQYASWATDDWPYVGSVFDAFSTLPVPASSCRSVVVSLGTIDYDFSRLVTRLDQILPADAEITWQLGSTTARPSRGRAVETMPAAELAKLCQGADVVVAHAGIGSALMALEAGRVPILVPRERRFGEHVDDHQDQIARELAGRGLAIRALAAELSDEHVTRALASRIVEDGAPAPIANSLLRQ
jgi:UDP-N-acetylglucosamine--N-acetylmuramyl-(pentapeptide) pyrophosphoryl-undecaprenol N-acetylglucosamine transferase